MDRFSQQLLQRIMIEFGNEQVFLLATCRSDEKKNVRGLLLALQERSLITSLPLLPFTEAETKTVIDTILQPSQDSSINARDIFLRTEGNPLVLMETLSPGCGRGRTLTGRQRPGCRNLTRQRQLQIRKPGAAEHHCPLGDTIDIIIKMITL